MSTFGDIRTVVQNDLGRSDDNTNAIILSSYNAIVTYLATSHRWNELEQSAEKTLTVDTDGYVLKTLIDDTTFYKLLNIKVRRDATQWAPPLLRLTPTKWDREVKPIHHITTNEPQCFMEWKKYIYFHPTPDETYTVEFRYYVMPAQATDTDAVVPFDNLTSVITNLTTGLCWSALEEIKLAEHFISVAQTLLGSISEDAYSTLDFSAFVSNRSGSRTTGSPWLDPFSKGGK